MCEGRTRGQHADKAHEAGCLAVHSGSRLAQGPGIDVTLGRRCADVVVVGGPAVANTQKLAVAAKDCGAGAGAAAVDAENVRRHATTPGAHWSRGLTKLFTTWIGAPSSLMRR